MFRLVIAYLVLLAVSNLSVLLINQWGLNLDARSFTFGVGVTAGLGLFAFLVRVWWENVTTPFRRQVIILRTERTPWEVMIGAYRWLFGGVVVFSFVCIALAFILRFQWH